MMKNALIWTVVVVMLPAGTVAHAQSISTPLVRPTVTATPLTDSAQRVVAALAKTPMASQQTTPKSSGRKCAKGLVVGAAGGAAVGFVSALALLMSSGGSDSAGGIVKGFTAFGGTVGLMIGGRACK